MCLSLTVPWRGWGGRREAVLCRDTRTRPKHSIRPPVGMGLSGLLLEVTDPPSHALSRSGKLFPRLARGRKTYRQGMYGRRWT